MKILYIAGYGRCGSTALDILLGNHPDIVGVGELVHIFGDWLDRDRLCSCGAPYQDCAFWKDLFAGCPPVSRDLQVLRDFGSVWNVPRILSERITATALQTYRKYQSHVIKYVLARSGKSLVVDSSKSSWAVAGRFQALRRLADQDVYVLHLVRHGLSVIESRALTGSNLVLQGQTHSLRHPVARTACGWLVTNLWTSLLGRALGSRRYLLIRYEDFIVDPVATLRTIGGFCGFNAECLVKRIENDDSFRIGHLVRGNRIRWGHGMRLKRSLGRVPGKSLRWHQRLLFNCIGGWLLRCYGYQATKG